MNRQHAETALQLYREIEQFDAARAIVVRKLIELGFDEPEMRIGETTPLRLSAHESWCTSEGELGCHHLHARCFSCPLNAPHSDATLTDIREAMDKLDTYAPYSHLRKVPS